MLFVAGAYPDAAAYAPATNTVRVLTAVEACAVSAIVLVKVLIAYETPDAAAVSMRVAAHAACEICAVVTRLVSATADANTAPAGCAENEAAENAASENTPYLSDGA